MKVVILDIEDKNIFKNQEVTSSISLKKSISKIIRG